MASKPLPDRVTKPRRDSGDVTIDHSQANKHILASDELANMPQGPVDALAWLVVATFVIGVLIERRNRSFGRRMTALAWGVFAVFWLGLVPHFAFVQKSIIEGILSAAAVPLCLYVAYLLYRGRDSLFVASRAVAVMGVIYLPVTAFPWLYRPLVEATTRQIEFVIGALGYNPEVTTGEAGMRNRFVFRTGGQIYVTSIVLACTGLGSMTIFGGLVAAVRAPLSRKVGALAVSVPIIWFLNLIRNVFIALAHGKQWFSGIFESQILFLFGSSNPEMVSFFVADRLISQSLSVVAIVAIFWLVLRELPELGVLVEDILFVLTGSEYDADELLPRGRIRADGAGDR